MVAVEVKKGGSQESASAQVLTSEHDDVAYQMWWELQQLRIHQSERSGKCESHLYREQRWCKSYISHTFAAGKSRCDARCETRLSACRAWSSIYSFQFVKSAIRTSVKMSTRWRKMLTLLYAKRRRSQPGVRLWFEY